MAAALARTDFVLIAPLLQSEKPYRIDVEQLEFDVFGAAAAAPPLRHVEGAELLRLRVRDRLLRAGHDVGGVVAGGEAAFVDLHADLLGVGSQLGSIEVGKIANLTVTRGDLLAKDRRIAHVFIDGKPVDLRSAAPGGDRGSNASGIWSLTVNLTGSGNEKQELTATLNLRQ